MGCTSSRLPDYDAPLPARRTGQRTALGVTVVPGRHVRDVPLNREEQERRDVEYERRQKARRGAAGGKGGR